LHDLRSAALAVAPHRGEDAIVWAGEGEAMRSLRLAAVAVAAVVALAACGGDDKDSSADDSASDSAATTAPAPGSTPAGDTEPETEGPTGGSVTMAVWSATKALDPTVVAGTGNSGGNELAAIYDTVMRYDPETGEYVPNTAESLEPNEDFTVWTLKLKPGITFTDGTPYNAEAVISSMQRHIEKRSNASSLVRPIANFEAVDDLTVRFTLSLPWNRFPFALAAAPGMIVSPTAAAALGDGLATNPVGAGAGPFMIKDFKPGEALTLVRNPDYWGGPAPLDELRFIFAGNADQTLEAFKAGTVQAAFLRDPAAEQDAADAGIESYAATYSASASIMMNNGIAVTCTGGQPAPRCDGQPDGTVFESTSPTADVRVRQAIAAAIELDTLNQRVYAGANDLSTELISEKSRWYGGVDGPAYDIDRAKELVAEVIAEGNWDGSIRVSCHNGNPAWGTAVTGMLEAAGFKVTLNDQQEVAANTAAVVVQKDYDIACFGSSISDAEPFFALNRDFNSAFITTGGGNFAGYNNPEVDALIAAGRSATTDDEVKEAITGIAEAYARDVPWLALAAEDEVVLFADDLNGVLPGANTVMSFAEATLG
jgi:peptide/nickel transport system substrate-binding protein